VSPLRDPLGFDSSPLPEAIQGRDSEDGQLGPALQDLKAGSGAELEQLEIAAAATAAGRPAPAAQVLDLTTLGAEQPLRLEDFEHPVTAYLNNLAPSSRRPQLSALDWIARRAPQLRGRLSRGQRPAKRSAHEELRFAKAMGPPAWPMLLPFEPLDNGPGDTVLYYRGWQETATSMNPDVELLRRIAVEAVSLQDRAETVIRDIHEGRPLGDVARSGGPLVRSFFWPWKRSSRYRPTPS
jgi:hypothetical protein